MGWKYARIFFSIPLSLMAFPVALSEQKRSTAFSLKNVAMATSAVLVLLACTAALIPSRSGRVLYGAVKQVKAFMAQTMNEMPVPFEIEVVRDNPVSILGHDLALTLMPASTQGSSLNAKAVIEELHDKGVVKAFSSGLMQTCTVVASAQSVDLKDGFMQGLVEHIGSEATAWRVALLHESAHCLRNVAAERIEALKRNKWVEKNPLHSELFALYMAEAYADAYAILALSAMTDPATGQKFDIKHIGGKAITWRHSSASSPAYRTEMAIQAAIDMVQQQGSGFASMNAVDFDRLAMRCALTGSHAWFLFIKSTPEVIPPEFMAHLNRLASAENTSNQGLHHGKF